MTQLESARKNMITKEMKEIAKKENVTVEYIKEGIKNGEIVIPKNKNHKIKQICGIGRGLKTKINVNLGTSPVHMNLNEEMEKLRIALKYGTDTVMDLSLGTILNKVRTKVLERSTVPVGTVPIYQVGFELSKKKKKLEEMKIDDILRVITQQAEEGVDFMTIHAGVTLSTLSRMENQERLLNIVSRGGSMLMLWMKTNCRENPMYEYFDDILKIAKKHDITMSLGDGLRPGALADATDRAQIQELITLGELAERCRNFGVQVMIEGPGHVPLNQVVTNIQIQKSLCNNAPFYVLGPVVTDIAPGYDHITSAIGGALAAYAGADFLCYVTPSEHLKLPTPEDVKEGTIAVKIAAHAADIAKGIPEAIRMDREMAKARRKLDWKKQIALSIDPEKARRYREESESTQDEFCSMCGDFCAIKQINEIL
ncbi:MAG: phosphomethylpyrimidine synthase ThiC [Spirochaetes bacterium]|nr:phosphomethylpyrimidine synthase ThiC [Spirochaetota bacterium]